MRILLIAIAVAATLASPGAQAQQAPQYMMGPGMMGSGMTGPGMMGYGGMPMMGMMSPAQHIEGRLAFLKTELKITNAQDAQWNAYAEALRANAQRMSEIMSAMMSNDKMMGGMMMGGGMMTQNDKGTVMALPERLDWVEKNMTSHLEMLQAIKGPATALYEVLSEEQRHVADELLMGHMGMM